MYPPLTVGSGGRPFYQIFKGGGGLDRISTFKGGLLGKKRITFFKGGRGVTFHVKNKLKSEIFNDKTSLQAKNFFSVITKASN